ncbi:universal stress protein [Desulfurispira natronophila]|uniref:Nucleotide-binding universal stress UspA family protein n=1 Tax=Desulfurispira natronophila TaxID=682562 RepID=A0A7W7Y6V0_9BACT|nr:universal stress protein [Desulfurispira natronophila]MBB5022812.1 nucleotide-binding universal stress UspA family protein [Desulfurispira natronophila]
MQEVKILVPVDNSDTARRTISMIVANRDQFPSELTLLYVINMQKLTYRMIPDFQVDMIGENARKSGEAMLHGYRDILARSGIEAHTRLELGSPREIISRTANEENFQMVIIGRRGRSEIGDVLFGSVANYVLHHVRCPVLLF